MADLSGYKWNVEDDFFVIGNVNGANIPLNQEGYKVKDYALNNHWLLPPDNSFVCVVLTQSIVRPIFDNHFKAEWSARNSFYLRGNRLEYVMNNAIGIAAVNRFIMHYGHHRCIHPHFELGSDIC